MIGPVVNSIGIILGSSIGSVGGKVATPVFRRKMNYVFTCITLGLGVSMTAKVDSLPPVVFALLIGTLIGEVLRIESVVMKLAFASVGLLHLKKPAATSPDEQTFRDQFAVLTVLFCFSALGVMGAMTEGMTGSPTLLIIKSFMDFCMSMLFAANLGLVTGVLAVPQFLIQTSILLMAAAVAHWTTPVLINNFSACAGIIMLGAGLRQCSLLEVPILSMLPGLFLVLPVTALWTHYLPF